MKRLKVTTTPPDPNGLPETRYLIELQNIDGYVFAGIEIHDVFLVWPDKGSDTTQIPFTLPGGHPQAKYALQITRLGPT